MACALSGTSLLRPLDQVPLSISCHSVFFFAMHFEKSQKQTLGWNLLFAGAMHGLSSRSNVNGMKATYSHDTTDATRRTRLTGVATNGTNQRMAARCVCATLRDRVSVGSVVAPFVLQCRPHAHPRAHHKAFWSSSSAGKKSCTDPHEQSQGIGARHPLKHTSLSSHSR